jgi:hypothetical protein
MVFKSVEAYLDALRDDPHLTMLPLGLVAELKGVSRSAVSEQIKSGSLAGVVVKGKRKTWRGVQPDALFAQEQRVREEARQRREKLTAALAAFAAGSRTATYAEIMDPVGMAPKNPRHRAEIGDLLAEASKQSLAERGFMIGAIVVQKSSGQPNGLFFQLARDLGALSEGADETEFWKAQCDKAFAHFSAAGIAPAAPAPAKAKSPAKKPAAKAAAKPAAKAEVKAAAKPPAKAAAKTAPAKDAAAPAGVEAAGAVKAPNE